MITPRQYQSAGIDGVREHFRAGKRRVLVVAPCGAGKTVMAGEVIHRTVEKAERRGRKARIIFLAHRRELIDQPSRKLDEIGIDHGVIMASHQRSRPWLPVQVCSVATLARRGAGAVGGPPDLIIIDEAHHARADSYEKILAWWPTTPVLGLTATPWRLDGKGLGRTGDRSGIFDESVLVATPAQLVEEGWLLPVTGFAYHVPDLRDVKRVGGDYNEAQVAAKVGKAQVVGDVVKNWRLHARDLRTIVFAVHVEHSKAMVEAFRQVGVPAAHVDGEMDADERKRVIDGLREGSIRVVSNCNVLTEGFDEPKVGCVVLLRPTLSLVLALQMVGRGRRPVYCACGRLPHWRQATCECGRAVTKRVLRVHDHAGVILQHGLPDEERQWGLDADESVKRSEQSERSVTVRQCRSCFALFPATQPKCPRCGWVNPKQLREVENVEGEQIPLEDVAKLPSMSARFDAFKQIVEEGRAKGRKPIWACMEFKEKFHHWPPSSWRKNLNLGV